MLDCSASIRCKSSVAGGDAAESVGLDGSGKVNTPATRQLGRDAASLVCIPGPLSGMQDELLDGSEPRGARCPGSSQPSESAHPREAARELQGPARTGQICSAALLHPLEITTEEDFRAI
jgi:hypothetical protein